MTRFWSLLVMMSFLIILDQMTKGMVQSKFSLYESIVLIPGIFNLTYATNTGAAWSFGHDYPNWLRGILFLYLPVAVCGGIFYWIIKSLKGPWYLSFGLSLVLAGAIGNLIDRFCLGYVVDFFDFYWGQSHFPVFNVADSCVTVGAFFLGYEILIAEPKRKKLDVAKS